MDVQGYEGLEVYQKAVELSEEVGVLAAKLPKYEQFELASQIRSAADSISSNISEGSGRSSIRDYINFLYNAKGSTQEVQTQLRLCVVHGYLTDDEVKKARNLAISVRKKLIGLIASLKRKDEEQQAAKKDNKAKP